VIDLLWKKNIAQKSIVLICGLLTIWLLSSCREQETTVPQIASTLKILDDPEAQQKLMLTFAKAYPEKISDVEFTDNDWTMLVNGIRFFFANGRFLPEALRDQWEKFYPYDFYVYPWKGEAKERQAAFKNPVYSVGSSFLFDALYFSNTEDESWEMQEKYSFLGVKVLMHNHIKPFLDIVRERVRIAAQTDPLISEWLAALQTTQPTLGWNWRTIAGTNRRSLHSYGIAIDLLPRNLDGLHTYWQWSIKEKDFDSYYMPPEAVIRIFEDHGFIWGGNWDLIDTMHFEYRPEILLLNNFVIEHLDQQRD